MLPLKDPARGLVGGALLAALMIGVPVGCAKSEPPAKPSAAIVWTLDNLKQIGGYTPVVEGAPKVVRDLPDGPAMVFDGQRDGIVLPVNPVAGWAQFTIEILFCPDSDGSAEQRFLHLQDKAGRRALIETRVNSTGGWWLDTYLKDGESDFVCIDPKKIHPTGRWYWAALRYDGKVMTSFVNGEAQAEGPVRFDATEAGEISVGLRLNRVYWFKGAIREVRFSPSALAPAALQQMPPRGT